MFGAPVRTALVHLSLAVQTERLLGTDERDRRGLVSLWADITTSGPSPLYGELFLGRPVGQQDASFVAPLGDVLSAAAVGAGELAVARSHVPALQGALGLRADKLEAVADRNGAAWDTLPLGLAEVSAFHRYAFLADALGWAVGDVLTLQRLSGIDPFAALAADPLAVTPAGSPLASPHATVEFVRLAQRVASSGLTPAELAYLAEHRVDPDDNLEPDEAATTALLDTIRAAVGEALAKLASPAGEPVPNTPPAPTPEQVVAAIVAAALGSRGGLVSALLHGADALADPTVADGTPELVQAFIAMAATDADPMRARRAHLLLSKVLLLADRLDLTAHECTVLGLGAVPLDSVDGVSPVFTLIADALHHAELRRTTRAPQDAFADVAAAARRGGDVAAALATATRRTAEVVTATAATLGVDAAALATPAGLGRLWTVLALIERIGVPVGTVAGWLAIADPATTPVERRRIARGVKEAVRAHLGPVRWREVAKPVSDRLRQRQRDALVAAVLHAKGLTSVEELYQELLIDPGSEPVLRTTRIRQAISTCQLFIQRCLLNIEPNVHPSAINAEHWEWMKRYRVWEANRKIFLYPENWLEPEFRDDKSHLFAELESTLLQNDVTADVVEDAFLVYLRKLDEIARLDVAGFYIEQESLDPGSTTLHVIGRTHGSPHQYFYRRMQHGMWTPWEPMGVDIEGDHIVPVVWRNRLHVFWVTFLQKADISDSEPSSGDMQLLRAERFEASRFGFAEGGGVQVVTAASKPPPSLAEAKVSDVRHGTASGGVNRVVEVQLNWSEYLNGAWSPKTSGGFGSVPPHRSSGVVDPASTFVHGSVLWADGEEVGVQVHLTGGMTRTFLLRGRNSVPEPGTSSSPPVPPYNAAKPSVNRYSGSGALTVTFAQKFTSVDGGAETPTNSTLGILGSCGGYSVLPAANGITIGGGDIGSLVSPFFFQDARRTFFVEPSLLETTTESWEEWIVPDPEPGITFDPGIIEQQSVVPFVPELLVPVDPDDSDPLFDPWEELYFHQPQDFLTSPDVGILYDDAVLGSRGGVDLTIVSALEGRQNITNGIASNGTISQNTIPVFTGRVRDTVTRNVVGETSLVADQVVLVDHVSLQNAGLSASSGTLRVVGRNGFANADTGFDLSTVVVRNFR